MSLLCRPRYVILYITRACVELGGETGGWGSATEERAKQMKVEENRHECHSTDRTHEPSVPRRKDKATADRRQVGRGGIGQDVREHKSGNRRGPGDGGGGRCGGYRPRRCGGATGLRWSVEQNQAVRA